MTDVDVIYPCEQTQDIAQLYQKSITHSINCTDSNKCRLIRHLRVCIHCGNQCLIVLLQKKQPKHIQSNLRKLCVFHQQIRKRFIKSKKNQYIKLFLSLIKRRKFNLDLLIILSSSFGPKQLTWIKSSPSICHAINKLLSKKIRSRSNVTIKIVSLLVMINIVKTNDPRDKMAFVTKHLANTNTFCGNINCKKIYLSNKYDMDVHKVIEAMKQHRDKQLIVRNKWYICKGCKTTLYCSRRCQKRSWSRQNHKYQCQQIHRLSN